MSLQLMGRTALRLPAVSGSTVSRQLRVAGGLFLSPMPAVNRLPFVLRPARWMSSKSDVGATVKDAAARASKASNPADDSEDLDDAGFDQNWAQAVRGDVDAAFLAEAASTGRSFAEDEFELNIAAYEAPEEYFRTLGLDMRNPPQLRDEHYSLLLHGVKDVSEEDMERAAPSNVDDPAVDTEALIQDIKRMVGELQQEQQQLTPDEVEYLEQVSWISKAGWNSFSEQGIPIKPEEFTDLSSLDFDFPDPLQQRRPRPKTGCLFCRPDPSRSHLTELVYTNVNLLRRFVNDRGMITTRRWNHNCSKHQRKLAQVIKQARYIGLMDFQSNWEVPMEFLQFREAEPDLRKTIIEQNRKNSVFFKNAPEGAVAFKFDNRKDE